MNTNEKAQNSSERDTPYTDNEVSIIGVANVLLRHRRLIIVAPLATALALGIVSISQPRSYSAHASFMPQTGERSSPGGAALLARQFGVDLRTERSGHSPQFYLRLLRSREILWQAATSEYDLPDDDGATRRGQLLDALGEESGSRAARHEVIQRLRDRITVTADRETGIVSLEVRSASGLLSEQIADRLIQLANQYNLETRQSQALAEWRFIEGRLEEAQLELREVEGELQVFLRQNRMFRNSPELMFEHDRLQRRVALRQELVSSLAQALEQARIEGVRDTPVITVIESADGSAQPYPRGTVVRAFLGGMSGLAIAILLAFLLEALRRIRQEEQDVYHEFNVLRDAAWQDLRRPQRLILGYSRSSAANSAERVSAAP